MAHLEEDRLGGLRIDIADWSEDPTFLGLRMHVRFNTQAGLRAEEFEEHQQSESPLRPFWFYTPVRILRLHG